MTSTRAMLAEFIGTFALMFIGGGAIIVTQGENLLVIALAHGLILAVMVSAAMHISGGQFNPAVSISLALIKRQPWSNAMALIAAQILGAVAGAMILKATFATVYEVGNLGATLGALTSGEKTNLPAAFVLEAIATFFLMFAVMGTAADNRGVGKTWAVGGFGIGLTVAANILCIGPLTGASMNPARSFGPALVAGVWDNHWLYWAAPIVGSAAAALLYETAFKAETPAK